MQDQLASSEYAVYASYTQPEGKGNQRPIAKHNPPSFAVPTLGDLG